MLRAYKVRTDWPDGERAEYSVEGAEPFGGLVARNEDHAAEVVDQLNTLLGLEPEPEPVWDEPENPIAAKLALAMADRGFTVSVKGSRITLRSQR